MVALSITAVSLDCADPDELGMFYQRLLDGDLAWANSDSVGIRAANIILVAQRVRPYTRPEWPGASVIHLDLSGTPDLDTRSASRPSRRSELALCLDTASVGAACPTKNARRAPVR